MLVFPPILAAALMLTPQSAFADKTAAFPVDEIRRPLTLPAGTIGLDIEGWRDVKTESFSTYPTIRYGLTDTLELSLFGVSYGFYQNPSGSTKMSASARITGFGSSTVDGTFYDAEASLEGKTAVHDGLAAAYHLRDIRFYRRHTTGRNCLEISAGLLAALSDGFFFIPSISYQSLSGSGANNAAIASIGVKYNYPGWDIKLHWTMSDREFIFGPGSQTGTGGKDALGIALHLRF